MLTRIDVLLDVFYQTDGICANAFLSSDETEVLGGGGFDADEIWIYIHHLGEGGLHGWYVGIEFRTLCTDGGIDIAYAVVFGCDKLDGASKEDLAVDVLELGSGVRKMIANVSHIGCSEQGITNGVDEHVGIAMAKQAKLMINFYAAKPQLTSFDEFMNIITETYAHGY